MEKLRELHNQLRTQGCKLCKLGNQSGLKGPVLYRGNEEAVWGIIGEAPGKYEDLDGIPFCGPAGQLLDRMIKYMNLDKQQQPYISNVILCRPMAPKGSGKENLKPSEVDLSAWQACKIYFEQTLSLLPKLRFIVMAGNTATETLIPKLGKGSFTEKIGKIVFSDQWPNIAFMPIYHPAFLLRKKNNPETYKPYQERTKDCLDKIKSIVLDFQQGNRS